VKKKNLLKKNLKEKLKKILPHLNERERRLVLASEAKALGFGGVSAVSRASGVSRQTIHKALAELDEPPLKGRQRQPGGGRKKIRSQQPDLLKALHELLDCGTRGDPMSTLRWSSKSTRKLMAALHEQGFSVSHKTVADLLHEEGFSLQANRKTLEGASHPDRNAQFETINRKAKDQQAKNEPVISVDTKKKEIVGNFKNNGKEWHREGESEKVQTHDFPIKELGRVSPYGVYDLSRKEGWVNVGIDHDTAAFAVESIRQWWNEMGASAYPNAKTLLITADAGGSNGYRSRLWKVELQKFANETGLRLSICHFPPGTSKWNKIEHQMFSFITQNWRGRPLVSYAVIVNLIGRTTTTTGLKIKCRLDRKKYPKGIKISDKELAKVNLKQDSFHGEWNYTIEPN
jgi:transposase